ncbi:MAG: AAA family ATPase [Betaproteobacteria bacterium]|nr:AAA family ATPase [Betaproteobacteria bacterium]
MLIDARARLAANPVEDVVSRASRVILGKEGQIRLALACILARGHLLIEDVPGVGKTTLSQALARLLGLDYQRIQFTSDLLPADIIGVSIFERESSTFRFHPGPVFAQIILADEINRASPKAQSALLEAMEEHQVTAEGETRALPEPFFVIATQNPQNQVGTFPLPESQLDRFLMRLKLGYPDAKAERELLRGEERRDILPTLEPAIDAPRLMALQAAVPQVGVSDALLDYVQALVAHTRQSPKYAQGLSPRAGLAVLRAAQAWAMMQGRTQVLPEDVQAILPAVVGHRLHGAGESARGGFDAAADLLTAVAIP